MRHGQIVKLSQLFVVVGLGIAGGDAQAYQAQRSGNHDAIQSYLDLEGFQHFKQCLLDSLHADPQDPAMFDRIRQGNESFHCYKNLDPHDNAPEFVEYIKAHSTNLEKAAADVAKVLASQAMTGSATGSSGTTSLLSTIVTPAVLSAAMEYGAITQTNNGNVATLRSNLYGLLTGGAQFRQCPGGSKSSSADAPSCGSGTWLRQISAYASLETNTAAMETTTAAPATGGTSTPATTPIDLAAGGRRMSSWGLRWDIRGRYPEGKAFAEKWTQAVKEWGATAEAQTANNAVNSFFHDSQVEQIFSDWLKATVSRLRALTNPKQANPKLADMRAAVSSLGSEAFYTELDASFTELLEKLQAVPDFDAMVGNLTNGIQNYRDLRDLAVNKLISNKFSFEFNGQHPNGLANYSDFRLVWAYQPKAWKDSNSQLTVNAALDLYDHLPKGSSSGRLRDYQAGLQFEYDPFKIARVNSGPMLGVFTFAGYYQYMSQDALLQTGVGGTTPVGRVTLPDTALKVLGTKGSIGVFQAKYTIQIPNSRVTIPISYTAANRSELIDNGKLESRFQIGLAVNMDSAIQNRGSATH